VKLLKEIKDILGDKTISWIMHKLNDPNKTGHKKASKEM
jgi:hypothetical protein